MAGALLKYNGQALQTPSGAYGINNLVPENIKENENVGGIVGTYAGKILKFGSLSRKVTSNTKTLILTLLGKPMMLYGYATDRRNSPFIDDVFMSNSNNANSGNVVSKGPASYAVGGYWSWNETTKQITIWFDAYSFSMNITYDFSYCYYE